MEPTLIGQAGDVVLDWVAQRAVLERYPSPAVVNPAGHSLRHVRLVLQGRVDLVHRSTAGKEVIVSSLGAGHWVGWMQVFSAPSLHLDLVCSAKSLLVALSAKDLRVCCEHHPHLYPLILGEMGQRMQLLAEWAGQSVGGSSEQRMARLLCLLVREQGLVGKRAVLAVTQARLATLARCSRQSANQLVGALETRGLIRAAYGSCEILDLQSLAAFADFDPESVQ